MSHREVYPCTMVVQGEERGVTSRKTFGYLIQDFFFSRLRQNQFRDIVNGVGQTYS